MSWTLVQSKGAQSAGSVTTLAVTLTSLPAVGNLIVVAMSNGNSTITSIQDNFFSTPYTQALKETSGRTSATYWFIVPSTPTGSFTVTLTVPSSAPCMAVFEFAGTSGATITCPSTSGAQDGGSTSTTPSAPALSNPNPYLAFETIDQHNTGSTVTAGTGWTGGYSAQAGGGVEGIGTAYSLNQTGSITPAFTFGTAAYWMLTSAVFSATPAGGWPLVVGSLSLTSASTSSVSLSYGTTSGGTSPYTNQLQRSLHGAGSWSNIGSTVAGATATFTDSTVSTGVSYDYQVHVTDSASGSQYSSTLNVVVPGTAHAFTTTAAGNWMTTGTWTGGVIPCKPYTITGCANNGSGYVRMTISAAASEWSSGDQLNIIGVVGTTEANGINQTIAVVSTTQFDLVNTPFVNAYVSGGTASRNDTVTINNAVTISNSLAVGKSPVPASGYAITFGGSGSIAQTSGTVSVYGSSGNATWTMSAGTTLQTIVPAGVLYTLGSGLVANGTSGSPCIVTCTLGSGAYSNLEGIVTATYTQFSNFAQSGPYWGIQLGGETPSGTITITNCTFNYTSYKFYAIASSSGTFTFQNNVFTNSIGNNNDAPNSGCSLCVDPSSTWTGQISGNVFDTAIMLYYLGAVQFGPNNLVGSASTGIGIFNQGNCANIAGNLIVASVAGPVFVSALTNNYVVTTGVNQLFLGYSTTPFSVTGCVFENTNASSTGGGICVKYQAATSSTNVTLSNNIVLPVSGTNYSSGQLFALDTATNVNLTATHNTQYVGGSLAGFDICYTGSGTAGQVGGIQANLFWDTTKVSNCSYKVFDSNHLTSGGTSNLVSPTNANYNASWNIYTNEPSTYTGNTYTYAGNGYQGNFTAYCGANDLADQNPVFIQSTRNLAAWGGTAAGGGTATVAAALATIAGNPSLITQSATGLLPWVRAGFVPTSSAFKSTGWSGDTSTADANGNAWPGSTPGFGAMGYAGFVGTGSITLGSITVAGSGGFVAPGSGAVPLGSITPSGSGGFTAPGSGSIILGSITPAGSGGLKTPGSGSITLGSISVAGSGGFVAPGSGSITLASIVVVGSGSASGAVVATGSGSVAFAGFTVAGIGISGVTATGAVTLGAVVPAGVGSFRTSGSGVITLGALFPAGVAAFVTTGSGSVALATLTVSGAGSYTPVGASTGSGLITLAPLTVTGAGSFGTAASGSITLGSIVSMGVGGFSATASGSVALAALTVAGSSSATGPGVTTGIGAITLGSIIVTSAASGGGVGVLYLPYEFTSVLIDTGNADPFFIDPEQTVLITRGLTSAD